MASSNQSLFLCFALLFLLGFSASFVSARTLPELSISERFEQWLVKHGRVYNDAAEEGKRFQIFKENVKYIDSNNANSGKTYKLGLNAFTDLTNEEFKAIRNGYKPKSSRISFSSLKRSFKYENVSLAAVPATMDWRKLGAVTPVKDQGQCGCCWAFSAVAATEGINQITTKKLISLSEQELVDCDINGEDQGCEGGLMDDAFDYIISNNGLATEAIYPYEGTDGSCNAKENSDRAAKITGYEDVPANSEAALLIAVAHQPVSVAIDAGEDDFQHYESGVFTGQCRTELDHAVTAVGYGTTSDGTKYWLVKNSWGTSWGMEGYIMMERGIQDPEGICGIAMQASYPTA